MITISMSILPMWVSTHWQRRAKRRDGVVLAILISLAAIPLADSAIQHDFPGRGPVSAVAASPRQSQDVGVAESSSRPQASPAMPDRDIEAVAAVVAKRYRVSGDATRQLVGAAFHEGTRIGVDPLLIIAVIAVESRFNPIAQSDGGAMGLMQVIPRYHADKFDAADGHSVLDPPKNIELGARVLKEYIRRGGTEIAGLQLYNGASDDPSNAYANRVLGEKQRLRDAVRRARDAARA
jgi:soluble lytic murein transglycosylase-like protein